MQKDFAYNSLVLVVVFVFMFSSSVPAGANQPGTGKRGLLTAQAVSSQSLESSISEFGKISLSMDAIGTLNSNGTIQVQKPTNATVRKAYLLSATTGFTGYQLAAGDVKLNGNVIAWQKSLPSSISSYNYWADISNMIKPIVDSSPAGLINLTIEETNSLYIDGEILVVIFDDPAQTTDNTVILYFGAQNISGDKFTINTGAPIDKNDPNLKLDLSLGISYGYQATLQYSIVDVNGTRLTTSAGGQDDGEDANGALITVGGIGDTITNPVDPLATPIDDRSDDELYDIRPLVSDGDQSIVIDTLNPSSDDNIFFAALFMGATSTVPTIDLDISLHNNPTTDADRAPYENIINFFADGFYEASNGAYKLGNITFHPNGTFLDQAEIVWVDSCHPSAPVSGFGTDGMHINMCDNFSASNYNFLSDNNHQRGGGYTLAHEFGHYYFSLYDEYVGETKYDNIFHFPHSTDKAVTNSIMNSQWNALGGNNNWLNFSIDKNDTQETAQYRVYQASGWTTLVRPVSDDPHDGQRTALPLRLHHAELADVAPTGDQNSPLDLPGTGRSELEIIWSEAATVPSSMDVMAVLPYNAEVVSILGQNISSPDAMVLLAYIHKDMNITGAGVHGEIILPDSTTRPVIFLDDGVAPDHLAGDGWYSAMYNYDTNGLYLVLVNFENDAGTAMYVSTAFQPSTLSDGTAAPIPDPVPVGENFNITQSLFISVSNVLADDHGDVPADATGISANNVPVSGKINDNDTSGSDVDVFGVELLPSGVTTVRVDNLAFGMFPHVRVIAEDGITVLFEANPPSIACGDYLNLPLRTVLPGSMVYIEVSDLNSFEGGLYQISVGNTLASDTTCGVYLPLLKK